MTFPEFEANAVDRHVGARIRSRRRALRKSLVTLAASLGLNCRELQDYESGHRHIDAARLFALARLLDVPLAHFFAGCNSGERLRLVTDHDDPAALSIAAHELAEAFARVRDTRRRRQIIDLARSFDEG
ncbi:MAG: helix-turn-helix transcriptional regulator [Asticcacaulis sp.]